MADQIRPLEPSARPDAEFKHFKGEIENGVHGVQDALQVMKEYFETPAHQVRSDGRRATSAVDALNNLRSKLHAMLEKAQSFRTGQP